MEGKRELFKFVSIQGENKRQCLSCDRLYIHKQDLIKHATREHCLNEEKSCSYKEVNIDGRKKYQCKICGRHFLQKRNFTLHLNKEHTAVLSKTAEVSKAVASNCTDDKNLDYEELSRSRPTVNECPVTSESDVVRTNANSDQESSRHSDFFNSSSVSDQFSHDEHGETNGISSDSSSDINSDCKYLDCSDVDICMSDQSSHSDCTSLNCNDVDNYMSDQSSPDGSLPFSDINSDQNSSNDSEFDNSLSDEFIELPSGPKVQVSKSENQALKIVSCFQKHNLTATACKDILDTMKEVFPQSERGSMLDMDNIYSTFGVPNIKVCSNIFQENPDEFKCTSLNCDGLRYKGSLSNQRSRDRQPRKSFVIADIQTQLITLLETPGILEDISKCKSQINMRKNDEVITDITDGSEYRRLLNSENSFLASSPYNLTAILNADGINLYSSSKTELWPFFIAINELSPSLRFSRDNLLLVAVWQGKGKPPFERLLECLGGELQLLYNEGVKVSVQNEVIVVKLAVVCGVFDLPAKASILNMTYFNGAESCISCEDPGIVVKQGKGHSRCYPFRESGQEFRARVHDEVVEHMRNSTERKRVKGFKGTSGLLAIQSYDLVQGTVPDYMHGILLGITNTLLSKWFSPCHSGQPYFIGKHIQTVSKRLQNTKPPLSIERLPRNLEKHFASLKATELQMWLLFYSGPCLKGILPEDYLKHAACLSEALYILLGEFISVDQIEKSNSFLKEFYSNFRQLYGQGSCGLNVHNACSHLVSYVLKWGPVWAWSCFPFEDANAALLQSAHGTGTVTKQVLKNKHIEAVVRKNNDKSLSLDCSLWKVKRKSDNCDVCGKLHPFRRDTITEEILRALPECLADQSNELKVVDRVRVDGKQFCSKKYSRLQRRISYIVLYSNSDQSSVGSIQYFIYNLSSNLVYAVVLKFISDTDQELHIGRHLLKVKATNSVQIVPVDHLIDTLLYINTSQSSPPKEEFVALMPSSHGHAILK